MSKPEQIFSFSAESAHLHTLFIVKTLQKFFPPPPIYCFLALKIFYGLYLSSGTQTSSVT